MADEDVYDSRKNRTDRWLLEEPAQQEARYMQRIPDHVMTPAGLVASDPLLDRDLAGRPRDGNLSSYRNGLALVPARARARRREGSGILAGSSLPRYTLLGKNLPNQLSTLKDRIIAIAFLS